VQTFSSHDPDPKSRPAPVPVAARSSESLRRVGRRHNRRVAYAVLGLAAVVVGVTVLLFAHSSSLEHPSSEVTLAPVGSTVPDPSKVHIGTANALPFSPTSVWNKPLAADAPVAENSKKLVDSFNHQWQSFYGTVGMNIDDFSMPIYTVPKNQATVPVTAAPGCNSDASIREQLAAVPIPSDARPANGSDHSLVIWQPATDTAWELWIAQRNDAGDWSSCWGGRIQQVSKSSGVFPNPYGVAASGLSYLGGSIKASELQSGTIKHALAIAVVHTAEGVQVAPATRNDGNSTADDAIPEGTRFRLDPSIDVTTLHLGNAGTAIARALQQYGMYVTDTSGAVVMMAEDGQTYVDAGQPNPYAAVLGSTEPYAILGKIPWNRLQVVTPPT